MNRTAYEPDAVTAARSVLLELARLLGEYRDHIVLVGGWVPELLVPPLVGLHVGSMDVDLALDHRALQDPGYRTIRELLLSRGYDQDDRQPFIFRRTVAVRGRLLRVQVDLLASEYGGTGTGHRTQPVQDVRARKARGCDLAFEQAVEVPIEGELPDGVFDRASIRVASMVPFLVMKGMALSDRLKEKDAYDIYYCVRNFQGGIESLADTFRPHLGHRLVREGLQKIAEKFASPAHFGPGSVAGFEELADQDERELLERDAYERVHAFLLNLGIV